MDDTLSMRRKTENEVVFRERNERVQRGFDELDAKAKEQGYADLVAQNDEPLFFYCECSDENCKQRIELKPSDYNDLHRRRDWFIIKNGHEANNIERVIKKSAAFSVVEKFLAPPSSASGLNSTDANNV